MKIDWTTLGVIVTAFFAFVGIAGAGAVAAYYKIKLKIAEGQAELAAVKQKSSDNTDRLDRQGARVSTIELALPSTLPPVLPSTPAVSNDTSSSSNQTNTGSGVIDGTSA